MIVYRTKQKLLITLTALTMACIILLTGCFQKNESHNNSDSTTERVEEDSSAYDYLIEREKLKNDYTYDEDISEYDNFINYVNSCEIDYSFGDLYGIEQALNKYYIVKNAQTDIPHSYSIISIDKQTLFNVVKANNAEYIENKIIYSEFSDDELMHYCELVIDILKEIEVADIDILKCNLGNLKILKNSISLTFASVNGDTCFYISPYMAETLFLTSEYSREDTERQLIAHETVHIAQKNCADNTGDTVDNAAGPFCSFYELEINPLWNSWILDAAAELTASRICNQKPLTYQSLIGYLKSIDFAVVLNDDNELNTFENLCFDHDLEKVFDAFSCETENDKIEILKMLYSIEYIQNQDEDLTNKIDPDLNNAEITAIKLDMKSSLLLTLSKVFYKNLAYAITTKEMNLNDVCSMISSFERDLNVHIAYCEEQYYGQFYQFGVGYLQIQNRFLELLSTEYNTDVDEIESLINPDNATIRGNSIGAEKTQYINSYVSEIKQNNKSIKDIYSIN